MRGKNGARPRGLSVSSENMGLFSDDPLMQGLALFGNGGLLLSHTPPNFTPGSYETSHMKRARAGSISGRLRSASDLEEKGLIDKSQKGVLKDLIISGDSELQAALDLYDSGDTSQLEALMESGLLDRRDSLDLLQDLDFGIMDLGTSADFGEPNDIVDTIGRKDSGGGDDGQGGGGTRGAASGDGSATAGGGSNGGGSNGGGVGVSNAGAARLAMDHDKGIVCLGGGGGGGGGGVGLGTGIAGEGVGASGLGGVGLLGVGMNGGVSLGGGGTDEHIDLSAEGGEQFDIGDMVFDTTFEHDFSNQEDDVDMKEGGGDMGTDATRGSHRGALGTTAAVGPLPVGGGVSQRSGGHAGDDPGNPRPGDRDPDDDAISGQEEGIDGHHHPHHRHHRRGRGVSGGAAVGAEGHGDVDDDETCLGSFGMLGVPTAPIGDFSPQFKFSFTDDIHLDLGGGLKDELRDLDSLSEPLPVGQHRGTSESYPPIMGMCLSGLASRHQLLSRGGPPVVKTEVLAPAPTAATMARLAATRSCTSAGTSDAAVGVGGGVGISRTELAAEAGASRGNAGGVGNYTTNPHESAAVSGRHTGHYAHSGGTLGEGAHGGNIGAIGAGAGMGRGHPEMVSQTTSAAAASHGAVRGRPVVSGMGIMVGGGPAGPRNGEGDEERKFVGAYSPDARRQRIQRFLQKREHRVWTKMVKYDVRKNFADTRMRVKGRFVKKEDEALLREVMACA